MSGFSDVAITALQADQARLAAVSRNLANSQTPGYRAELASPSLAPSFESLLGAGDALNPVTQSLQVPRSQRLGALQQTNHKLDLAIEGTGFFQLMDGARVVYSRRGDFHLDELGVLRGANEMPVAGSGGEIRLSDAEVTIRPDGTIEKDGAAIGRIAVAQFPNESRMEYLGDGLYLSELPPVTDAEMEPRIRQGFVEASNVRPMDEMTQMLEITRRFGASTQALKAYDEMLGLAFDNLGVF